MCSAMGSKVLPCWIPPFGNLRLFAFVQLPGAYRRLRVLHRQLVPRHSSRTLTSLFLRSCSLRARSISYKTSMQLSKSLSLAAFECQSRPAARGNDTRARPQCQGPNDFSEQMGPLFTAILSIAAQNDSFCLEKPYKSPYARSQTNVATGPTERSQTAPPRSSLPSDTCREYCKTRSLNENPWHQRTEIALHDVSNISEKQDKNTQLKPEFAHPRLKNTPLLGSPRNR